MPDESEAVDSIRSRQVEGVTDPQANQRREQLERLKVLDDLVGDQQRLLDRSLITLASGSFGVSILFAQAIAPQPETRWLLALAWGAFALAIITTLLSFRWAADAAEAAAELERKAMETADEVSALVVKRLGKGVDTWNRLGIASFILGTVALTAFAAVNLLG